MSTLNKGQDLQFDLGYEVGKIGSSGVRYDTLALNIRPKVRSIPSSSINKQYVSGYLDTFKTQ